jgi:pSer/pThr/pTyr-binding forkhead associated (FHA) protein
MERCPNCGVETRPGDQFCLNCGNRLTGSQPSAPQPPAFNQWGPPPGMPAAPPVGGGGAPQFPPPPAPAAPPFQNAAWPGGPAVSPTMPTVQAPFGGGPITSGATVPNSGPVVPGSAPDEPTVITPPEVLEPTVRAPETSEPEMLERTAVAPQVATASEGGLAAISSPNLETQAAIEEEVEVTITTVNESPAKLLVTRNGQTREFLLKKPDISIGRAPSNDIALSGDQLASRRHAVIHFDGVNYTIQDLVSANGTYINGVELRSPTLLSNGDHIGIGEHELVFFTVDESLAEPPTMTITQSAQEEFNPETIPVPGQADTIEPSAPLSTTSDMGGADQWGTAPAPQEDGEVESKTTTDEVVASSWDVPAAEFEAPVYAEVQAETSYAEVTPAFPTGEEIQESTIIERIELTEESPADAEEEEEEVPAPADISIADRLRPSEMVNEEDMPLPVPQLPEIPTILSAIKSLDSTTAEMRENLRQAKMLEEEAQQLRDQLRAATEAISNHDNSVAVLAQRLRVGVADVSNRLNKVIEEVNRADESLSIVDLMKLIDDVRNDPRDIYTLGSLARRARELAQFFEMHQHVNQILSECLSTLNDLLSADLAKPES